MFGDCENMSVLDEEVETLRSIFFDELKVERDESNGFSTISMQLYPATADNVEEQYVRMCLLFKIPPEYPESIPEIHIHSPRGLLDDQVDRIKENLFRLAENRKGSSMLYELIDAAKERLTEENRPREDCAICLYGFVDGDVFMKTECYHYFHSHCMSRYMQCKLRELQEEKKEASKGDKNKHSEKQVPCPVCRVPITFDFAGKDFPEPIAASSAVVDIDPEFLREKNRMEKLFRKQLEQGGIIDIEAESRKYLLEISNVPDDPVEEPENTQISSTTDERNPDSTNSATTSIRPKSSSGSVLTSANSTESLAKTNRPWPGKRSDRGRPMHSDQSNASSGRFQGNETQQSRPNADNGSSKEDLKQSSAQLGGRKYQRGPRYSGYPNDNRFQPSRNNVPRYGVQNSKPPYYKRTYRDNKDLGQDESFSDRTNTDNFASEREMTGNEHSPRRQPKVNKSNYTRGTGSNWNERSGTYSVSSQEQNHRDLERVDYRESSSVGAPAEHERTVDSAETSNYREKPYRQYDRPNRFGAAQNSYRKQGNSYRYPNREDRLAESSKELEDPYEGQYRENRYRQNRSNNQRSEFRDSRRQGNSYRYPNREERSAESSKESEDPNEGQHRDNPRYRQNRSNNQSNEFRDSRRQGHSYRYPNREERSAELSKEPEDPNESLHRENPRYRQNRSNNQSNEFREPRKQGNYCRYSNQEERSAESSKEPEGMYRESSRYRQNRSSNQSNEFQDYYQRNPNQQPHRNNRARNNFHNDTGYESQTGKDSRPNSSSKKRSPSAEVIPESSSRELNKESEKTQIESDLVEEVSRMTTECNGEFTASQRAQDMCEPENDFQDEVLRNCGPNALRSPPGFANPLKKVIYGLPSVNPPPGFHRS